MIVQKFGGTSIGNPVNFRNLIDIITKNNKRKIVVLSSVSNITNMLQEIIDLKMNELNEETFYKLDAIRELFIEFVNKLFTKAEDIYYAQNLVFSHISALVKLISEDTKERTLKKIIVYGEIITSEITEYYFKTIGIQCKLINAVDFMRIDRDREPDYYYIKERLEKIINEHDHSIFLTQGFICKNFIGETDNLNRGGSDKTATIIGKVLNVESVEIWSDRDGLLNNDPRYVSNTFCLGKISYEEAEELASFGAKILHPSCIKPAKEAKLKIVLKNTFNPKAKGTIISERTGSASIKAVAAKDNVTVIKITASDMLLAYGFLSRIFQVFDYYKTPVDMIATSEITVAVSIDDTTIIGDIIYDLNKFGNTELFTNQTIIAVVGIIPPEEKGIIYRIFESINEIPVRMISYGAGSRSVHFLISSSLKIKTLNLLNEHLFSKSLSVLNKNTFEYENTGLSI